MAAFRTARVSPHYPSDENMAPKKPLLDAFDSEATASARPANDLDFSDRVLLSPPALHDGATSLDQHVPHAGEMNLQAHMQNGQAGVFPALDHSNDMASSLLHGLHIRTDVLPHPSSLVRTRTSSNESGLRSSASASSLLRRVPSIRAALHSSAGSLSPGSVIGSPQIAAMLDMTPLPSPITSGSEFFRSLMRTRSRGSSIGSTGREHLPQNFLSSTHPASSPPRARKPYTGLRPTPEDSALADITNRDSGVRGHERTRSTSDYAPETVALPKQRNVAVSVSGSPSEVEDAKARMHREHYRGSQRGRPILPARPPTPPSTVGGDLSGEDIEEPASKKAKTEVYTAQDLATGLPKKYQSIRQLGQGTFSTVYLAVRQVERGDDTIDYGRASISMKGIRLRSKRLVAVKVVEHGPTGGAEAERVEVSLQREVEIMKVVKHSSIVHLKAFGTDGDNRALLVMNYCPGGDLFEVASKNKDALTPLLVRRIFSELVSAVRYLHQKYIVHRDIKLENVLLNIPVEVHHDISNWQTIDRAVITLTDLGLSKCIPEPPESPLLTTRCGSEDYAAPELLMGQPYDGRQTDAWALGVVLYSLMEGRLPFDPLPGARGDPAVLRARTPHRIARIEWAWYKYGDKDGDWDPEKGKDFQGAFTCVDGLLKRNTRRKNLSELRELPWVKDGITVDGGLRWVEEESM